MSHGILIFQEMGIGVGDGDFSVKLNEDGSMDSSLILSTSYSVIPIWLRNANDALIQAKSFFDELANNWPSDVNDQKKLLISELEYSLQVFVACGIALDALYDQIKPHAKIPATQLQSWKDNKTGRAKQIALVLRQAFNLKPDLADEFQKNITEIIKCRDMAVHPSTELKQACRRPDVPVGVDWKFSMYRYENSLNCFSTTMNMLTYLFENKSKSPVVNDQINNIFLALQEMGVVEINA